MGCRLFWALGLSLWGLHKGFYKGTIISTGYHKGCYKGYNNYLL